MSCKERRACQGCYKADAEQHPMSPTCLTEQLWDSKAWNWGLESRAGVLGEAWETKKEPMGRL